MNKEKEISDFGGEVGKVVIVGGVAGGASCAARLRRLSETAEIVVLERGEYVSFANCGLPYRVGEVISEDSALVLANPQLFWDRFRIQVKTLHEAVKINRENRTVEVRNVATGEVSSEPYDFLVLSPGAQPLKPPIPGLDLPGVFTVRTIPDTRRIRKWIEDTKANRAVIAGGGFIGLEMAENLRHRGLEVAVLELAPQIMPPMDPEMVRPMERLLNEKGIRLVLGDGVSEVRTEGGALSVVTKSGLALDADLVIAALGVRPEVTLAKDAGLEIGTRGGIVTDAQMRTLDPKIFAVGDAVEVLDVVTEQAMLLALAGPANRQGRIAADAICGREARFRGVQGTAGCEMFGMVAAMTGASEKALRRAGREDFEIVHLHPKNHVGYFPGAEAIHLKLIFRRSDGKILGAQACGKSDVPRKIDTISAMIQLGGTVFDLEEAELCYAPQFGAAKDAVNFAGMIAANLLRGDVAMKQWEDLGAGTEIILIDVRDAWEVEKGRVPGAVSIPLNELRKRLEEIPKDRPVGVYCGVGQRGYYAARLLEQHGVDVFNFSGGWETYLDKVSAS